MHKEIGMYLLRQSRDISRFIAIAPLETMGSNRRYPRGSESRRVHALYAQTPHLTVMLTS